MGYKGTVLTTIALTIVTLLLINPVGVAMGLDGYNQYSMELSASDKTVGGSALNHRWFPRSAKKANRQGPEWWDEFEEMWEKYKDFFLNND